MAYTPIAPLLTNGSILTPDHIAHIENGIVGAERYADEAAAAVQAGTVSDTTLDAAITRAVEDGRITTPNPQDLTITEAQEGVYQIADGIGQILGLTAGKKLPAAAKTDLAADIGNTASPIRVALNDAGLGKGTSDAAQVGNRLAAATAGRLSEPAPGVTIEPLRVYLTPSDTSIGVVTFDEATALITVSAPHKLSVGDMVTFVDFPAAVPNVGADNTFYVLTTPSETTLTLTATPGGAQHWHGNGTANAIYKRAWAWDSSTGAPYAGMRITESTVKQTSSSFPWDVAISPNDTLGAELTALSMRLTFETDGDGIDLILADRSAREGRIIVDGLEAGGWSQADFTAAAINGNRARLPIRFADARRRVIELVFEDSNAGFFGFDVGVSSLPAYPLSAGPKGARWMFAGDSFTEGAGSGTGWTYTRWVSEHLGFKDLWRGGVGSTGYVADGNRSSLSDRYQQDIINQSPQSVLIAMGVNDINPWAAGSSAVTTAAATIWDAVLAAPGIKELVIVGPWPNAGGTNTAPELVQMDAALRGMARDRGLKYISPISEGWKFGTADGIHPNAAGHEFIGRKIAGHLAIA